MFIMFAPLDCDLGLRHDLGLWNEHDMSGWNHEDTPIMVDQDVDLKVPPKGRQGATVCFRLQNFVRANKKDVAGELSH